MNIFFIYLFIFLQVVVKQSPKKSMGVTHSSSVSCSSHSQVETITTSVINGKKTVVKQTKKVHHGPLNKDANVKVTKHTTIKHSGQTGDEKDASDLRIHSTTRLSVTEPEDKIDQTDTQIEIANKCAKTTELETVSVEKDTINTSTVRDISKKKDRNLGQNVELTRTVSGQQEIEFSAKSTEQTFVKHHTQKSMRVSKDSKFSVLENAEKIITETIDLETVCPDKDIGSIKDTRNKDYKRLEQKVGQYTTVNGKQETAVSSDSKEISAVKKHSKKSTKLSKDSKHSASGSCEQPDARLTKVGTVSRDTDTSVVKDVSEQDGKSLEQRLEQNVSLVEGKQEIAVRATSTEQAAVKEHVKKSTKVSKDLKHSASGSSEQTVVQLQEESDAKQEVFTKSLRSTGKVTVEETVEKTDQKHDSKSSKSTEKTVVQRVNKGNRKQETIITTMATSAEQHFVHVTTVKTVKKSKSKGTKKR